jgi:hypothetical protein
VNVDVDPDDAARVAETLGLGLIPLADIDHRGLAAFTVHPDAVGLGSCLVLMLMSWPAKSAGCGR